MQTPMPSAPSRKIIFYYPEMVLGGAEMLIANLAERWAESGVSAEAVCVSAAEAVRLMFRDRGIPLFCAGSSASAMARIRRQTDCGSTVYLMVFFIGDYAALCGLGTHAKVMLYALHPNVVALDNVSRFRQKYFRGFLRDGTKTRSVVMMDDFTRESCVERGGVREGIEAPLVRISVPGWNAAAKSGPTRRRSGPFELLAVARADFPFKGYLFGLIDAVALLGRGTPKVHLTIVSYGPGFAELQSYARNVPDVLLVEGASHDELALYYGRADLYVGMGTTIVEAASMGVPAAVVRPYTKDLETSGLFGVDTIELAAKDGSKNFDDMLLEVIHSDEMQYASLCKAAERAYEANYNLANNIRNLEALFEDMAQLPGMRTLLSRIHWHVRMLKRNSGSPRIEGR